MMRSNAMAAIGLAAMLAACGNPDSPPEGGEGTRERVLPVQGHEVQPRDLSRIAQVSAPIEPFRTIRLASRTEGVLTEVLVEEGDSVASGQMLARIDVSEQRAELARAEARLSEQRANFERMEQLKERNYIDAASFEAARAELAISGSEVELWQTRVDFGTVRSTIDGTVVERHVEPGEAISRHEPLFAIADLSSLVVRPGVSELDVGNLQIGDAVLVFVDAVSRQDPVPGLIRRIFPTAETASRLITVEIELPDALELGVRPGFLARAQLLVDQRDGVLAVPAGSVAESSSEHFVMVVNGDERLERRVIEPGIIRGPWREVLGGLESGEVVVSANPMEMNAGDRVRVVDLSS
jgi:membrane fusion protein, multidrug efflux system